MVRLADRFTALYRKYQTAALVQRMHPIRHWPWALPQIPKEIRSPFNRLLRMWGNPLHYATRCPVTLSYHHKEPSPQFIVHWWKSALTSKLSR
ncbi:hypothetical protein AVEN_43653-1 [Araneus ventricosus]|uniref:Uncharacterized protein n=1 Tax=Araneus ventricosus TaxID=182803 RepID=A0A4Y2FD07_ARAVE|nr:hypothetical protein AVEN_43653-1 [Araneus ventricosus]